MFPRRMFKRCAVLLVSVMFASIALAVPDDNNSSVNIVESDWEGELILTIPMQGLLPGNANGNGTVDAEDIVIMVDYMMGKNPDGFEFSLADVNGDNVINVADVVMILQMMPDNP